MIAPTPYALLAASPGACQFLGRPGSTYRPIWTASSRCGTFARCFPASWANDDITLCLKKGEVHALLGENGAGKSTLMSTLRLYQPDGEHSHPWPWRRASITQNVANDLGIGMVHQHFKLVHNFTVTENIVLGMEPTSGLSGFMSIATSRPCPNNTA